MNDRNAVGLASPAGRASLYVPFRNLVSEQFAKVSLPKIMLAYGVDALGVRTKRCQHSSRQLMVVNIISDVLFLLTRRVGSDAF